MCWQTLRPVTQAGTPRNSVCDVVKSQVSVESDCLLIVGVGAVTRFPKGGGKVCFSKEKKRQDTEWEKSLPIHMSARGLAFRLHRELIQLDHKTIKLARTWTKDLKNASPKSTWEWPMSSRKDTELLPRAMQRDTARRCTTFPFQNPEGGRCRMLARTCSDWNPYTLLVRIQTLQSSAQLDGALVKQS